MSHFLKQVSNRSKLFLNLDSKYYQKISCAQKSRFDSRLTYDKIQYPPTVEGNEDYYESAKKEENGLIKHLLGIKNHPESAVFPEEYSLDGPPKGRIYEKIPFKYTVEKGKVYSLCTCGYSNNQPFCDSSHKMLWTTHVSKKNPKFRPIKYVAEETKDVWFCNCKQSKTAPMCDGTHKTEEVQKSASVKQ